MARLRFFLLCAACAALSACVQNIALHNPDSDVSAASTGGASVAGSSASGGGSASGGSSTGSSGGVATSSSGSTGGSSSGGGANCTAGQSLISNADINNDGTDTSTTRAGGSACNDTPGQTTATFTIDASQTKPVSPYIYGFNGYGDLTTFYKTRWGLIRAGGNTATTWNWQNDECNTGFGNGNGTWHSSGNIGGLLVSSDNGDRVADTQARGGAFLATVPTLGYVAAKDATGSPTVQDDPSDFLTDLPTKGSAFCACPAPAGKTCPSTSCTIDNTPAGAIYQDEFVNYMMTYYGNDTTTPMFFELDNEANYWPSTHAEVWASANVTYDDITGRNITFASAVKAVTNQTCEWSASKTFGPVVVQDGMFYDGAHQEEGSTEFLDYYLAHVNAAATTAGHALVDVLDVHYYTDADGSTSSCLLGPRLFWDQGSGVSATQANAMDFTWGDHSNPIIFGSWYPRKMVPRLLGKIAAAHVDSSSVAGLAFSEYDLGCDTTIEGGVAEVDVLGVFGQYGVFAATAWPGAWPWNADADTGPTNQFIQAAFDVYRNFDGSGTASGVVGDTSISAGTNACADTSIYAFVHQNDGGSGIELVAVNKTNNPITASIDLSASPAVTAIAAIYQLIDGASAQVTQVGGALPALSGSHGSYTLQYVLPALSASTIVLR